MSSIRASVWSVTINNPTSQDEEEIALARQRGWEVDGQLEKGENGTPHYQLRVKTGQVRFSAMKKAFSRAHIEVARNDAALQNYVHKEETRVGDLPTQQDMYPSLSKFWYLLTMYYAADFEWGSYNGEEDSLRLHRAEMDRSFNANPLIYFDQAVGQLIRHGYVVESIATNPAVRSSFKNYWRSIFTRTMRFKEQNSNVLNLQNADDNETTERSGQEEGLRVDVRQEGEEGSSTSSGETSSQSCA